MFKNCDAVWVNASPSLKYFDLPLQQYLGKYFQIASWEYIQNNFDESSCIQKAVDLLYDFFLNSKVHQVHLIGHGVSGVIALLFAQRYPWRISSLTLLAVAPQPAITWHTHYYTQRRLFVNISRQKVLLNIARSLFGSHRIPHPLHSLINALNHDLDTSPCMHSLFKIVDLPKEEVSVPLMVCGSNTDPIVSRNNMNNWKIYLKSQDTLWLSPDGYHFFHYFYPELVGKKIKSFWQNN
ncbi:MAG: alpha/beta hydrolase [Cyanobacteria bacterium J06639_18]